MDFSSLVALLPSPSSPLPISANPYGISSVTASNPSFVEPTLSFDSTFGEPSAARALLICAPGAVGKTTLARELAARLGWPLWDLAAGGPVGLGSYMGALWALGIQADVFRNDLAAGRVGLIVDALDEGRVKVTEQAFKAFLGDLASLATGSAGGKPCIVLLGRTQIAENAWSELLPAQPALLTVDWFDRERANQYIEKRLEQRSNSTGAAVSAAIRTHRSSFEQARDTLFDLMAKSVESDPSASSFLGYAPVLDAIAQRLADSANFEQTRAELLKQHGGDTIRSASSPVDLLDRVCTEILEREHRSKLGAAIRGPLGAVAASLGWSNWDALYTPQEQAERLLCRIVGTKFSPAGLDLPAQLLASYEQALDSFFGEHPFLLDGRRAASVVFEAFVLAKALFGPAWAASVAESRFFSSSAPATRILSDFYFLFMHREKADLIPLKHVPALYRSLATAETAALHAGLTIEADQTDDGEEDDAGNHAHEERFADVEFFVCSHVGPDGEPKSTRHDFRAPLRDGHVLPFSGSLSDAVVSGGLEVQFFGPSGEFEIGPGVDIECDSLKIAAAVLIVNREKRGQAPDSLSDPSVILRAPRVECDSVTRVTVRGELQVSWPGGKQYPWTEYFRDEIPAALASDEDLRAVYFRFRRIVLAFRSHSKGSLARYYKKVEHSRVLKGELGKLLLEKLVSDGVIRLEGDFYHWMPDAAGRMVGVSWLDLRRGEAPARLLEYLQAFLKTRSQNASHV